MYLTYCAFPKFSIYVRVCFSRDTLKKLSRSSPLHRLTHYCSTCGPRIERSESVTAEIEGPYALRRLRPVNYYVTRKWRPTARVPED